MLTDRTKISLGLMGTVMTVTLGLVGKVYEKIDAVSAEAHAATATASFASSRGDRQGDMIKDFQKVLMEIDRRTSRMEGKLDAVIGPRTR